MQRKRDMHDIKKSIVVTGDVVSGAPVPPPASPEPPPNKDNDSRDDIHEN